MTCNFYVMVSSAKRVSNHASCSIHGPMTLTHRLATPADIPALTALMDLAIGELQRGFSARPRSPPSRRLMITDCP